MQKLINNTTIILPSARAIRSKQLSLNESTTFLPNYITMSDFISKLCIVENFKIIDNDSRILLLLEASDFKKFESLQIQRNFFTFTKNSSYIFKFFEELSAELYDIDGLNSSDIYGEYEEHILILQELYKRYEALCIEKKVLDKIFLPKLYKFNESFVKKHTNIELYLDGHLTNFEFELFLKCCEFCDITIHFATSFYNSKMQKKFLDLSIELEPNYNYKISLNTKEIISKEKIAINKNVKCESFSESILQVSFIQKKIYDYIQKGYKAQNIAVVLPDEKMAETMKSFDEKFNFNFAMGTKYSNTKIYEKLNSTCKFIDQNSEENKARLKRSGDEIYENLLKIYYEKVADVDIYNFLDTYKEMFSSKIELKIFNEELYKLKYIMPYMLEMNVKSLLSVFLQRLAACSLDDVRGGKITVMGVLETRNVEFDGVVIVDFNDSNVPKRSDKDMFLNTAVREMANLPTMGDRENLQKHYYEMLIKRSKDVAISFVKSSQSSESRFLKQLNIKENNIYDEKDYANILFENKNKNIQEEQEIILDYSFGDKKLSATRLKAFLTCKRKFYFKYIQKIYLHEIPKDMPQEYKIGLDVHEALKKLYEKQNYFEDAQSLQKELHKELDLVVGDSEFEKYLIEIQKRNLVKFCDLEIKRFKDGWKAYKLEENLSCSFAGITLTGQIDRIDKRNNEIYVLDYKTGKYPLYNEKNVDEATDFQLEFYHLLAGGFGNVVGCAYYDLKESKVVDEVLLDKKLAILESNIKDLLNIEQVNFLKCEDIKNCLFCEYKIMCGRE